MHRTLVTALLALAWALVLVPAAQATSTYASTISSTPTLMSFWRLSEQGAQADAEGITAADTTGADPGTYHQGVSLGVPGSLEGDPATAAHFGAPDGYVSIPAPSFSGAGQFTIEGWVNLDSAANNVSIVGDGAQTTQHTGFLVDTQTYYGQPALDFVFGDGTALHLINGQVYAPGAWYYFAASFDGAVVRFYLNGAQVGATTATIQAATTPLLIAANPVIAGSGQLTGSVDDVALYSAALSASTIQQHYQLGISAGTPPTTSLQVVPPALTNQTSATLQFGSPTVTPAFQCQLDGTSWQTCSSPDTLSGLADGRHRFSVRAINRAGQADPAPPSTSWTVQTAPPKTTVTVGPAAVTASTIATFSFASGTGVSFACQVDGRPAQACSSPYSVASLSDGQHTFSVYATDAAGNTATTATQYSWSVDTAAPTSFIAQGPSATNPGLAFVFEATKDSVSYRCQIDGGAWGPCSTPFIGAPRSPGTHTVEVMVWDALGNVQPTPTSYTWTVVAPSVTPAPMLTLSLTLPARIVSTRRRAHELALADLRCHRVTRCLSRSRAALTPHFAYRVSRSSQVIVVLKGPRGALVHARLSLKAPGGFLPLPAQLLSALKRPGVYSVVFRARASGATAARSVKFTVQG